MKHFITPFFILMLVLASCSPRLYDGAINRMQRDTVYVNRIQVDSVFRRDSVYIREKNDTVIIYKERIREKYKLLRDTTYIHRTDTLTLTQVRMVEKQLTKWQSFSIVLGRLSMVAILVAIIFVALRKWLKKRL